MSRKYQCLTCYLRVLRKGVRCPLCIMRRNP